MSLRKKTTGFTLIELLVVIAIIAILAAILFPVFAKARNRARQTACLSNMKQLALAIQMYLGDWDGFYPMATGDFAQGVDDAEPHIGSALLPYVENNFGLWRCPIDNIARPATYHACSYGFRRNRGIAYSEYGWPYNGVYGTVTRSSLNIGQIPEIAEMIIICEPESWQWTGDCPACPASFTVEGGPAYCGIWHGEFGNLVSGWTPGAGQYNWTRVFPHQGSGNFAFGDGHAKAITEDTACMVAAPGGGGGYCIKVAPGYHMQTAPDAPLDWRE